MTHAASAVQELEGESKQEGHGAYGTAPVGPCRQTASRCQCCTNCLWEMHQAASEHKAVCKEQPLRDGASGTPRRHRPQTGRAASPAACRCPALVRSAGGGRTAAVCRSPRRCESAAALWGGSGHPGVLTQPTWLAAAPLHRSPPCPPQLLAPGNSHLFQQLILKPHVSLSTGFLCNNSLTSASSGMQLWRRAGCKSRLDQQSLCWSSSIPVSAVG